MDPNWEKTSWSLYSMAWIFMTLLLAGDIERNPGPRPSPARSTSTCSNQQQQVLEEVLRKLDKLDGMEKKLEKLDILDDLVTSVEEVSQKMPALTKRLDDLEMENQELKRQNAHLQSTVI